MSVCNTSESWSISAGWVFRGTEYAVCADVRDDVLFVQVEDKLTADRWRGQFDAKRKLCGVHECYIISCVTYVY